MLNNKINMSDCANNLCSTVDIDPNWINCYHCNKAFHIQCVGLTNRMISRYYNDICKVLTYICNECKAISCKCSNTSTSRILSSLNVNAELLENLSSNIDHYKDNVDFRINKLLNQVKSPEISNSLDTLLTNSETLEKMLNLQSSLLKAVNKPNSLEALTNKLDEMDSSISETISKMKNIEKSIDLLGTKLSELSNSYDSIKTLSTDISNGFHAQTDKAEVMHKSIDDISYELSATRYDLSEISLSLRNKHNAECNQTLSNELQSIPEFDLLPPTTIIEATPLTPVNTIEPPPIEEVVIPSTQDIYETPKTISDTPAESSTEHGTVTPSMLRSYVSFNNILSGTKANGKQLDSKTKIPNKSGNHHKKQRYSPSSVENWRNNWILKSRELERPLDDPSIYHVKCPSHINDENVLTTWLKNKYKMDSTCNRILHKGKHKSNFTSFKMIIPGKFAWIFPTNRRALKVDGLVIRKWIDLNRDKYYNIPIFSKSQNIIPVALSNTSPLSTVTNTCPSSIQSNPISRYNNTNKYQNFLQGETLNPED